MSELPCCPFCGSSQFGVGYDGQPAHTLYVVCESCGATGPRSKSRTGGGVACAPAGVEATDGWKGCGLVEQLARRAIKSKKFSRDKHGEDWGKYDDLRVARMVLKALFDGDS